MDDSLEYARSRVINALREVFQDEAVFYKERPDTDSAGYFGTATPGDKATYEKGPSWLELNSTYNNPVVSAVVHGSTTARFNITVKPPSFLGSIMTLDEQYARIKITPVDETGAPKSSAKVFSLVEAEYRKKGRESLIAKACDFMLESQGPRDPEPTLA